MTPVLNDDDVRSAFAEFAVTVPRLGEGGFKQVYLADDQGLSFVLKVLLPPISEDDVDDWTVGVVLGARELREMPGLRSIDHPNVARIIDGPSERVIGGHLRAWYREEYYSGGSLADRLSTSLLNEVEAIELGEAILAAIEALWEKRIVHRDIKPQNVVYAADGRPVLIDLGIAYFKDMTTLTDAAGMAPLTLGFASPEQLLLRSQAHFDYRTDLFLLGILLYVSLTAKYPFSPKDPNYATKLATGDFSSQPLTDAGVTAPLISFIERLLSPEPSGRYRKIEHAIADLEGVKP